MSVVIKKEDWKADFEAKIEAVYEAQANLVKVIDDTGLIDPKEIDDELAIYMMFKLTKLEGRMNELQKTIA